MYKIIVTLVVSLLILWLLWYLVTLLRKRSIGTLEMEDIVEGGVPNRYFNISNRRDMKYTQYTDNRYSCMYEDDGNYYAFQNELYAVKINGKWLFKYGVYGGVVDIHKPDRYFAEYNMHKVSKKVNALIDNKIKINGNVANANNTKVTPIHYTHCYQLHPTNCNNGTNEYIGAKIGSWLHVMEMAGHRAMVWWLMHNEDESRNEYNIAAISDKRLEGDSTERIKELINTNDTQLRSLYKTAYPGKGRISLKNIKELTLKKKNNKTVSSAENELYSYLSNRNALNEYDDSINITFNIETSKEAEFFCPIRQTSNSNFEQPSYCNNITNVLKDINKYIVQYQKYICENLQSKHNACPIQRINVFENYSYLQRDSINIEKCIGDKVICNPDVISLIADVTAYDKLTKQNKQTNVGTEWYNIIDRQIKGDKTHTNNNGVWDLIDNYFGNLDRAKL